MKTENKFIKRELTEKETKYFEGVFGVPSSTKEYIENQELPDMNPLADFNKVIHVGNTRKAFLIKEIEDIREDIKYYKDNYDEVPQWLIKKADKSVLMLEEELEGDE